MSLSFPPAAPRLVVPVYITGPRPGIRFNCALDTGSELTVLPANVLRAMGFDLSRPVGWTTLRGATGRARAPLVRIPAVAALDRVRTDMLVAAHDLTSGSAVDGLLGLDFFRGFVLTLDFARGRIALAPPKRW